MEKFGIAGNNMFSVFRISDEGVVIKNIFSLEMISSFIATLIFALLLDVGVVLWFGNIWFPGGRGSIAILLVILFLPFIVLAFELKSKTKKLGKLSFQNFKNLKNIEFISQDDITKVEFHRMIAATKSTKAIPSPYLTIFYDNKNINCNLININGGMLNESDLNQEVDAFKKLFGSKLIL